MNTRKTGDSSKRSTSRTGGKPTPFKKSATSLRDSKPKYGAKTEGSDLRNSKTSFVKKSDSKFDSKPGPKGEAKPFSKTDGKYDSSKPYYKAKERKGDPLPSFNDDEIRLNKYLSNAGVCSRREADVLIQTGVVTINGVVVNELGYKVKKGDKVQYDGETINAETKRYVLLNKPKGFITTMDDPLGRKTVMRLVVNACKERVYPVGRLDRETTGLLLFTNDGDMAKKLTHP